MCMAGAGFRSLEAENAHHRLHAMQSGLCDLRNLRLNNVAGRACEPAAKACLRPVAHCIRICS